MIKEKYLISKNYFYPGFVNKLLTKINLKWRTVNKNTIYESNGAQGKLFFSQRNLAIIISFPNFLS